MGGRALFLPGSSGEIPARLWDGIFHEEAVDTPP